MVEKAALVLDAAYPGEYVATEAARAVLDAILPQVTTVAELEALPSGSLLVTPNGEPVRHLYAHWQTERAWLETYGTLTLVWQPEVTA